MHLNLQFALPQDPAPTKQLLQSCDKVGSYKLPIHYEKHASSKIILKLNLSFT